MFKCNEYFDGKVMSLAFNTADRPATVGVMAPGDYSFGTEAPETMTVVSGELIVTLPGQDQAQRFGAGESFDVPGDSRFEVQVPMETAYLCTYG